MDCGWVSGHGLSIDTKVSPPNLTSSGVQNMRSRQTLDFTFSNDKTVMFNNFQWRSFLYIIFMVCIFRLFTMISVHPSINTEVIYFTQLCNWKGCNKSNVGYTVAKLCFGCVKIFCEKVVIFKVKSRSNVPKITIQPFVFSTSNMLFETAAPDYQVQVIQSFWICFCIQRCSRPLVGGSDCNSCESCYSVGTQGKYIIIVNAAFIQTNLIYVFNYYLSSNQNVDTNAVIDCDSERTKTIGFSCTNGSKLSRAWRWFFLVSCRVLFEVMCLNSLLNIVTTMLAKKSSYRALFMWKKY